MKHKILLLLSALLMGVSAFPAEWKGEWIQAVDCENRPNTWQMFRKTVEVRKVPKTLKARIAVDSKYWMWINGELVVYEGGLKRGPSPAGTYYDVVDLAPHLQKGQNTIAILMWFFGKQGFSHKSSGVGALLFDAQSRQLDIVSDGTWQAQVYRAFGDTGEPLPNYRLPESNIRFDGRKDLGPWYKPGSNVTLPQAKVFDAKAENATYGELVERPTPLFVHQKKQYVSTRFDENTRILHCRMPYNGQVCPTLKVEADRDGLIIDMRTEDYVIGKENSIRGEYVTRRGVQEYEALGWMNGNEVQYRIPEGVKVIDVGYVESGYDTQIVGGFRCNDPFFNELWKRSARTMYVNMRDTYFDCPDRERSQWWGDVVNDIQESFYTLSRSSWQIVNKGIYELFNWQRADGTIFAPVPAGNWNKELPCQMLMSVGWYGIYTQYYYTGDSSFVRPVYNRLHRYLHDVWKIDDRGHVDVRKGGWSWADWGDHIDLELLTNEWYYLALKAEREFARQLNLKEDIQKITGLMQRMAGNFEKLYWTGNDFRSASYKEKASDDRAQALAVLCGFVTEDKYPKLMEIFKSSFYSSPLLELYVQQALFKMGEGTYALERARKQYSLMLSFKDQTTLFEGWTPSNSINHAWSSGMTVVMGRDVCGIEPTSPGFRTFRVKPQMAGLTDVETNCETPYGFIRLHLQKTGSAVNVDLTVPRGTRATVEVGSGRKVVKAGRHRLTFNL